jgi:hypothetical protein
VSGHRHNFQWNLVNWQCSCRAIKAPTEGELRAFNAGLRLGRDSMISVAMHEKRIRDGEIALANLAAIQNKVQKKAAT